MSRMRKPVHLIAVLSLVLSLVVGIAATVPVLAVDVLSDGFEAYVPGSVLPLGGWVVMHNGAGDAYQYVDGGRARQGEQSLHLQGQYYWCARTYHPISLSSDQFSYQASVFVDSIVGGSFGCACVEALDYSTGVFYGRILFHNDGKIYACNNSAGSSRVLLLDSYSAQTWYDVRVDMDLSARTFDVYIDGALLGSGVDIADGGNPTAVSITTGSHSIQVWFDDVVVSDPPPPPPPEGSTIRGVTAEVDCDNVVPGATVTLKKDGVEVGSTTGDGDGNYELTATETGGYQVVASKTGYKDQTESITVAELGQEYTLDFIGDSGLVPCAPNMSYVLKCVNHWLFPPDEECGLTMSTVLKAVNAWLFPT